MISGPFLAGNTGAWCVESMAARRESSSSSELENLVRRIVSSLNQTSFPPGGADGCVQANFPSVDEEINDRFSIPRAASGRSNTAPSSTGTNISAQHASSVDGYTNYRSRSRQRTLQSRLGFSHSRRSSVSNRRRDQECTEVNTIKEIVLLPSPTYSKVPRCNHKVKLQKCGLILDGCSIDRSWNEMQVREFFSTLFANKLKDKHGLTVG